MVEFVGEVVGVEVQLRGDGTARPLAFLWGGRRLQIEAWGRERTEEGNDGARRCYLVQTAGPETWELCQDLETAQWTLTRHWAKQYGAV
jgi:hypothetical protein